MRETFTDRYERGIGESKSLLAIGHLFHNLVLRPVKGARVGYAEHDLIFSPRIIAKPNPLQANFPLRSERGHK